MTGRTATRLVATAMTAAALLIGCVETGNDQSGSTQLSIESNSNRFEATGVVERGDIHAHSITVPAGVGPVVIDLRGTGDADLYTRVQGPPTLELYDCRPYRSDSNEICLHLDGGGVMYVSVVGTGDVSEYTLRATWGIITSP